MHGGCGAPVVQSEVPLLLIVPMERSNNSGDDVVREE